MYDTLIPCEDAATHIGHADWAFFDCRYSLLDANAGREAYRKAHIAGAPFCSLDHDLSGPKIAGTTGRHPLPKPDALMATFSRLGIDSKTQVVAYDADNGVIASRLWWSLKWAGHNAVAVLDGGFARWQKLALPTKSGEETRAARNFVGKFQTSMFVTLAQVDALRLDPAWALIDVRAADRYRGEGEVIDPKAGHIPGSLNLPFSQHLNAEGLHRASAELNAQIAAVAGERDSAHVVYSCGSGVTATHAALMHVRAGRGMPKINPGSFSEWIADGSRDVATGDQP